jgi:hypothetical protein
MTLSREEKLRFLRALEEDGEFRLAVAGLLGLREVLEELRRLREDFNKFVKMSEERWAANEKRWQENERRWEEQFKFNRWMMAALSEIRDALGGGFEYFAARAVKAVLKEGGVECDVRVNVTLPVNGFKEVDLFCPQPLIVGEVSVAVRSVEEAEGLLEQLRRSVEAAERFTGAKAYMKAVAVEFASRDAAERLKRAAEEEGIYLILGRDYERLLPACFNPS